jgi:hypothetical protein
MSRQLIIVLLDLFILIAMAEIIFHESLDHSFANTLFVSMELPFYFNHEGNEGTKDRSKVSQCLKRWG